MTSLIAKLSRVEQRELLEDLNYLHLNEVKTFCQQHAIPFSISIEREDGSRRKTGEDDRKGVILNRLRHYLQTGDILPATCFPAHVVCFADLPKKLKAADRLYYGQYDKENDLVIELVKKLTGGKFKNGAVARIIAREYWSQGIAPTYQEFADAWLKANDQHDRPNPEWAFLSDRADHKDTKDWKQLRNKKAQKVLTILHSL